MVTSAAVYIQPAVSAMVYCTLAEPVVNTYCVMALGMRTVALAALRPLSCLLEHDTYIYLQVGSDIA